VNRRDDRFNGHAILAALRGAHAKLDRADKEIGEDEALREAHARLVWILDYADAALNAVDPELVPLTLLDQITANLNQLAVYAQNFLDAPGEPVFLTDRANGQANEILAQIPALALRVTSGDLRDVQGAVSTSRRSASQHLRNIEAEVETTHAKAALLDTQLTEQASRIQAQDARLDSVLTQAQEEISTAEARRQAEFGQLLEEARGQIRASIQESDATIESALSQAQTRIQAQDARLDSVLAQVQEQISTAEAQRQAELGQLLEEARSQIRASIQDSDTAIDSALSQARTTVGEMIQSAQTASDEALAAVKIRAEEQNEQLAAEGEHRIKTLDELLASAVKTVGVIGSTGMAGGYQIAATREKKAADVWRLVAAFALLGAIAATIFAVVQALRNGFHVGTFLAEWAIALPFVALAGYAAFESSQHREQARLNRQLELQLASLDTYLVALPEEEQNRIRAELADRFFRELKAPEEELPIEV
jgi:hypothetical protein